MAGEGPCAGPHSTSRPRNGDTTTPGGTTTPSTPSAPGTYSGLGGGAQSDKFPPRGGSIPGVRSFTIDLDGLTDIGVQQIWRSAMAAYDQARTNAGTSTMQKQDLESKINDLERYMRGRGIPIPGR